MSKAGVAGAVAVAAAVALAGPAPAQQPDVMVSLGDSYASGEGSRDKNAPEWDENADGKSGCHRGPNAWPRRLGVIAGWHLACTGAVIDDVVARGQKRHKPDNRSQLSRLVELDGKVEIDAVLLTIGGNDMGFAGKIAACFSGHKCLRDLDKLDRELAALKIRLVDAYDRIADASWGELIVVGYPDIFPDRDERDEFYKCGWLGENPKRGTAEKTGVWHLQDGLERTIREAAEEADVEFVSTRDALDGREMCTRNSVINKLTPTGKDRAHPNATGQRLTAETVREALDDLYADGALPAAAADADVAEDGYAVFAGAGGTGPVLGPPEVMSPNEVTYWGDLRWSGWTKESATATGVARFDEGGGRQSAITVTLDRVKSCAGLKLYTRVRGEYADPGLQGLNPSFYGGTRPCRTQIVVTDPIDPRKTRAVTRPKRFQLGDLVFSSITWRRWGKPRVRGRGKAGFLDFSPPGLRGRVRLSDPGPCPLAPYLTYRRVQVRNSEQTKWRTLAGCPN